MSDSDKAAADAAPQLVPPSPEDWPFTVLMVPHEMINSAPYNPKKEIQPGDRAWYEIEHSLDRFNLVDPLVWNKTTGNLVGGHQRLKIRKYKGFLSSPCTVVEIEDIDAEMALNVALNKMRGDDDPVKLAAVLEMIENRRPELFDEFGFSGLRKDLPEVGKTLDSPKSSNQELPGGEGPPEMALMPYEHYDYVMLVFRDQRDFMAAIDHFGLEKTVPPPYVGKKRIGLCRVVDGSTYLARIRNPGGNTESQASSPVPASGQAVSGSEGVQESGSDG